MLKAQRNAPQASRIQGFSGRPGQSCSRTAVQTQSRTTRRAARRQLKVQAFKFSTNETAEQSLNLTSSTPRNTGLVEAPSSKQKLTVSWAGAGVFFFWQLGAMKYLAEKYDLTKVPMVGASGGALAAVLAACGVNADEVIQKAYDMSVKHNVWERPLGLLGCWGGFIEQWLDELLPDNAHELCRGRITVVVTTLPNWAQVGISDFKDKKDLINTCMASSHVPFFLDYKLTRPCRGKRCVDGSFPDFFTGLNSELLRSPEGGSAVIFDYFDDVKLPRKGRMDMLEVKSIEEIRHMMQLGYEYAAKLHADGNFDHYELAQVMLQGKNGHMSEVLVSGEYGASPKPVLVMASDSSDTPKPAQTLAPARSHGLVIEMEDDLLADKFQSVDRQSVHAA